MAVASVLYTNRDKAVPTECYSISRETHKR